MKTLKNFTQKLNLNTSKVANLTHVKGGLASPNTAACADAQSRPTNTYSLLCGNDTVDTQK